MEYVNSCFFAWANLIFHSFDSIYGIINFCFSLLILVFSLLLILYVFKLLKAKFNLDSQLIIEDEPKKKQKSNTNDVQIVSQTKESLNIKNRVVN